MPRPGFLHTCIQVKVNLCIQVKVNLCIQVKVQSFGAQSRPFPWHAWMLLGENACLMTRHMKGMPRGRECPEKSAAFASKGTLCLGAKDFLNFLIPTRHASGQVHQRC